MLSQVKRSRGGTNQQRREAVTREIVGPADSRSDSPSLAASEDVVERVKALLASAFPSPALTLPRPLRGQFSAVFSHWTTLAQATTFNSDWRGKMDSLLVIFSSLCTAFDVHLKTASFLPQWHRRKAVPAAPHIKARIPHVFFHRLVETGQPLSRDTQAALGSSLQTYMTKPGSSANAEFAGALLQYLSSHGQDPDNASLGLPLNLKEWGFCVEAQLHRQAAWFQRDAGKRPYPYPPEHIEQKHRGKFLPCSRHADVQVVREWVAKIAQLQPEDMVRSVQYFADVLSQTQSNDSLGPSQLVIAYIEHPGADLFIDCSADKLRVSDMAKTGSFTFARIIGSSGGLERGGYMDVVIDPYESRLHRVPRSLIFTLHQELVDCFQSVVRFSNLFDDNLSRLSMRCVDTVSSVVDGMISGALGYRLASPDELSRTLQSLSVPRLQQCLDVFQSGKVTALLRAFLDGEPLPHISEPVEHQFDKEASPELSFEKTITRLITTFAQSCDFLAFEPLRSDALSSIPSQLSRIPERASTQHRSRIEAQLFQWSEFRTSLQTGTAKAKLTTMWLTRIRAVANDILQRAGFSWDAIPDDYIEKPPLSMARLRQNHLLISSMLDCQQNKYQVMAHIEMLKRQIYPHIDQYIADCVEFIVKWFAIPKELFSWQLLKDHFLEQSSSSSSSSSSPSSSSSSTSTSPPSSLPPPPCPLTEFLSNISAEDSALLRGVLDDFFYLERLAYLEKVGRGDQVGDAHIVPISGLLLSCLARMQCELSTALEVWQHRISD